MATLSTHGERVEKPEQMAPALERALANAPAVVDVVTSQAVVSSDAQKGLGYVPDYQALTVWDDAERAAQATRRNQLIAREKVAHRGGLPQDWRSGRLALRLPDRTADTNVDPDRACAYDRLVANRALGSHFKLWGIADWFIDKKVSDHWPVWATFDTGHP